MVSAEFKNSASSSGPTFSSRPKRDVHVGDLSFAWTLRLAAASVGILLLLIAGFLAHRAWPSIHFFGARFLTSSDWDPVQEIYGALPVIFGTLVSSFLAVLLSTPLSIGVALFLNELAPRKVAGVLSFGVEMLAAIPSVVYGLWGIFVLAPWLRTDLQPFLGTYFGFLPFFQGPPYGVGMMTGAFILAIMITPTIFTLIREIFRSIPQSQREAALALGATRWEMMKLSVLGPSQRGVSGAVTLGLGRALGETMAVTMVIGNRADISASLFSPAQTMASVLANEYAEATTDMHLAALIEIGLVLFMVTIAVNAFARLFILRKI